QSNEELQEFAHVASHDLKTPLRNIAGFIQLLKRRLANRLKQDEAEFIAYAVLGVKQMNAVIDDLLSMSKVSQYDLDKTPIPFEAVVQEVLEDMQLELAEKKAAVEVTDDLPTLHFSKTNAKRLFQNLISNAIKYQNGEQPQVQIHCHAENGHWKFAVQDNGIGIPPGFEEKAFKMFERFHPKDHYKGTGIGLAICKKIVENNHGKIWYTSEEHQGTTFYFTLPR
ncbi:MAG: ATP-binding protein, partial [Bacteroidota bacterium]